MTAASPPAAPPPADPAALAAGYEQVALVLQGGGALGAYQGGVFEALDEAGIRPTRVVGISIGAINAALIAGNPPERRLERLRAFWERVSGNSVAPLFDPVALAAGALALFPATRELASAVAAGRAVLEGQRGFFRPRVPAPLPGMTLDPASASFYDVAELRATLEELVDFGRLNSGQTGFAVGAVDVASGNFAWFDAADTRIDARHVLASGALPPAFAAVEIDGRFYWDGGLVSNTPLEYVLEGRGRQDTLAFQVDLWSAKGVVPRTIDDVLERDKDIRYSSRTRRGTDMALERQRLRRALAAALPRLPASLQDSELWQLLESSSCRRVFNVVHLIYRAKRNEGQYKDYELSPETMREHWQAGRDDARASLRPDFLVRPEDGGVATHDVHRAAKPPG
jgi:NTE family protein